VASPSLANDRLGVTPGKLKLIGLLAAMFVVVLYVQYGRSGDEVALTKPEPRAARASKRASKPSPQTASDSKYVPLKRSVDTSAWKEPELQTVTHYDPFALPPTFPQPKPTITASLLDGDLAAQAGPDLDEEARKDKLLQMQQSLAQMRQQGVQVIITKGDEFVALIGKKVYRVGDEIGGFKITSIDTNGVQVEGAIQ
jgi:hypothetical protein